MHRVHFLRQPFTCTMPDFQFIITNVLKIANTLHATVAYMIKELLRMSIRVIFQTAWLIYLNDHQIMWHTNNKDANQAAHLRSLVSTVVIRYLESAIASLTTYTIANF